MKKIPTATMALLALASLGDAPQIETILFLLHFTRPKKVMQEIVQINFF
jgi:hypothetical protein